MRIARAFVVALLTFVVYIVFTGSVTIYDLITGVIAAIVVGALCANIVLQNPRKVFDVRRWIHLVAYALHYFFIDEVKAHLDVARRILSPSMPINPGIVRVPYEVVSDYAITAVANSITNTPGTVVVDIDTERKVMYVHWIDVKTTKPSEARKHISETFERFAKKVFD